jgi:hypothetical protein
MDHFQLSAMFRFSNSHYLVAAAAIAAASAVLGGDALPKDSPFLPKGGAPVTSGAATEAYQLSGYVAQGMGGLIGVTRTSDKRSVWVPLGGTTNEISALSYDTKSDQAVIRVDGRLLTIALRKSAVIPGANTTPAVARTAPETQSAVPAAVPAPPEPPPPAVGTPAFQEREARMLVTDLLEIGLEQRKAYEQAQRQAAAQNAGQPASAPGKPAR